MAEEVLGNMRTVRSFAGEYDESMRYRQRLDETVAVNKKQAIVYVGYAWCTELFDLSILVAVLWYGGHLVISKKMDSSQLMQFLLYQLQLGEAAQVTQMCTSAHHCRLYHC